jgi:hypothetical protein
MIVTAFEGSSNLSSSCNRRPFAIAQDKRGSRICFINLIRFCCGVWYRRPFGIAQDKSGSRICFINGSRLRRNNGSRFC